MEIENKIWLDDKTLGYMEEEHKFDKDKYIDDIFGYQEMLYEIIEDKRDMDVFTIVFFISSMIR